MQRETRLKIYELASRDETLDERIARLAAAAPAPCPVALPQSLPDTSPQVDIATLTGTELHDLVYAAASTYLQSLTSMTKTKAHTHAERVASMALQMTAGQDYMTRGTDPRA